MKKFDWEGFKAHVLSNQDDNDAILAANSQLEDKHRVKFDRAFVTTQGHHGELVVVGPTTRFCIYNTGRFTCENVSVKFDAHKYLEVMEKWFV